MTDTMNSLRDEASAKAQDLAGQAKDFARDVKGKAGEFAGDAIHHSGRGGNLSGGDQSGKGLPRGGGFQVQCEDGALDVFALRQQRCSPD